MIGHNVGANQKQTLGDAHNERTDVLMSLPWAQQLVGPHCEQAGVLY